MVDVELYPRGCRHRPPGEWRQVQPQFDVAGITYRRRYAERFVRAAADCDDRDVEYGLRVAREPDNPHDPKAIAVFGYWMSRRWFRSPVVREVHIGYVPRDVALDVPDDAPIAAEIESLYLARRRDGGGNFVNVQAYLLLPGLRSGFWEGREHPFR